MTCRDHTHHPTPDCPGRPDGHAGADTELETPALSSPHLGVLSSAAIGGLPKPRRRAYHWCWSIMRLPREPPLGTLVIGTPSRLLYTLQLCWGRGLEYGLLDCHSRGQLERGLHTRHLSQRESCGG